jgi:hypothetical protein
MKYELLGVRCKELMRQSAAPKWSASTIVEIAVSSPTIQDKFSV